MQIRTRRQQIQELTATNQILAKTQELLIDNITTLQERDKNTTGNRYRTYADAVIELARKYAGTADWGVLQAGNIVDLRAAYIVGQGIKVGKVEPDKATAADKAAADAALAFAQRFIDKNELDHELVQDLAKEAEIEGKTLLKIFTKTDAEGIEGVDIIVRHVSWTSNSYKVKVNADDYMQLESVTWTPKGGKEQTLLPGACVYKRFAGRLDIPDDTMPRTAKCLTQIENLDMALYDWREINSKFAAPVPDFQMDDAKKAEATQAVLEKVNWKLGKAFVHGGTFSYVQPSSDGQKAIESEILTLMKLISGTTGIPINALGAPELTTKLGADSQAQLDLIAMSTSKEREVWRGAYQELLEKAMRLWNATTNKTPLRPELIKVDLPVVTEAQWQRIIDVWLPLKTAGEITRKTLLSQVPGLDVEKELAELDAEDAANMDKFTEASGGLTPDEVAALKADKSAADPNVDPAAGKGNVPPQFAKSKNQKGQPQ